MKKKGIMRLVAFALSIIMVLENPMTALASNDVIGEAKSEIEDSTLPVEDDSTDMDVVGIISDSETDEGTLIDDSVDRALEEEAAQEEFEAEPDEFLNDSIDESGDQSDIATLHLTKELVGKRTENSLTYELSDHSITTFIYSDAVSYQTDNDEWRLIDNRLRYIDGDEEHKDEAVDETAEEKANTQDINDEKNEDTKGLKEIDFAGYTNVS